MGIVVLVIAIAGLAAGCGSKKAANPLDYVPADAKGVGFIDFQQLAREGMIDKILDLKPDKPDDKNPRETLAEMGIDANKDLVAGAIGFTEFKSQQSKADTSGGLILLGTFKPDTVYEGLKKDENPKEITYKNHKLIQKEDGSIAGVLDGKVLLFASEAYGKQVIDVYTGAAAALPKNSPLLARVKDKQGASLWFTADVPPQGQAEPNPMLPGIDPSKIKTFTFWLTAASEATDVHASIGCTDPPAAESLKTGLQGAVGMLSGMVMMFSGGDPEISQTFTELTQNIKINAAGANTTVDLALDSQLIDKLKAVAAKMKSQTPPGGMGPGEFGEPDEDDDDDGENVEDGEDDGVDDAGEATE